MLPAEQMYFHNAPLAHVVAYYERLRAARLDRQRRLHRRATRRA